MQFSRAVKIVDNAEPAPSPSILVDAAVASVKPSALIRAEERVTRLRDQRSEIADRLGLALREVQSRDGVPREVVDIQAELAVIDEKIKPAHMDMLKQRQEFALAFEAVGREFRQQAAAKIRESLGGIAEAHELLAAVDRNALYSGIEFTFRSPTVKTAIDILRGTL